MHVLTRHKACCLLLVVIATVSCSTASYDTSEPAPVLEQGGDVPTYSLHGLKFSYAADIRRARNLAASGCDPCPPGEYQAAPCAGGGDTTPTCRACSFTCPNGHTLIEPCGVSNDVICAPDKHAECAKKAVVLDTSTLMAIMQGDCTDCASMVPHINQALSEAYMACPLRLCAFLAQARHASAGFSVLRRADLVYVAGAIHLQPNNFRLACKQLPALKAAFEAEFSTCSHSNKCDCGSDAEASKIVGKPEYAFRAGAWWLYAGAGQVLGDPPCGDLRRWMDYGLGGSPYWTTPESPGIGFQLLTTCVAGYGEAPGRQQLADYYTAARSFFPDQDPDPSEFFVSGAAATVATAATIFVAILSVLLL